MDANNSIAKITNQLQQQESKGMGTEQSELLQLKNLGMASVNILRAIGVNTYGDLQELGAVGAYLRIKDRDINVSKVMLYALQGALMDVHWNDLDPQLKSQLVAQADKLTTENV